MNRRAKRCLAVGVSALLIAAAGFLTFAERWLCAAGRNPDRAADAVVVLAGTAAEDRQRLAAGKRLMHRHPGRVMILPLRHASFTWSWAVSHYNLSGPIVSDRIIIGNVSGAEVSILRRYGGTYLEAFKTARIMQRRHLTSAVIVSSSYHMRRARLAFEQFRHRRRLRFFYHAVDPVSPKRSPWWMDRSYFFKILTEYKKLIAAAVLYDTPDADAVQP